MAVRDGPLVLINASDLGYGARFSFVQEYFNLLCSDLSSFPVARAVTASSAVPVLFEPVVLENYRDCKDRKPPWLEAAEQRSDNDPQLMQVVTSLQSYYDQRRRHYAHFVDGGITDNLGLRAIYEIVEVVGGARIFMQKLGRTAPKKLVILSVNAATEPEPGMDLTNRQPSLEETINATSDVQLRRYNAATLELIDTAVKRWAGELSTTEQLIQAHFIQLTFKDIADAEKRHYFNAVPTSFRLSKEQVDRLVAAGHQLLQENEGFQRFLAELE
jgi:NTE family protein